MQPVAYIRSPYAEKFGVPRQGNLVPHAVSEIVFEPDYCNEDCVRGLSEFSHIWLIWQFHCNGDEWHPTVRPPRLGGNTRLGVFATRSPFRPNALGLSVVRLLSVEPGPVLRVSGADMVDGTPIYDIKPYIPYADSVPEASSGFTASVWEALSVKLPDTLPESVSEEWLAALQETLAQDPRPAYQNDPQRLYHMVLKPFEVHFRVEDNCAIVTDITPYEG